MQLLYDERVRTDLQDRRDRLVVAAGLNPEARDYRDLLAEVDSALARMDSFFAVLVCVATIGLSLYVFFYWVGKKLTSWQE